MHEDSRRPFTRYFPVVLALAALGALEGCAVDPDPATASGILKQEVLISDTTGIPGLPVAAASGDGGFMTAWPAVYPKSGSETFLEWFAFDELGERNQSAFERTPDSTDIPFLALDAYPGEGYVLAWVTERRNASLPERDRVFARLVGGKNDWGGARDITPTGFTSFRQIFLLALPEGGFVLIWTGPGSQGGYSMRQCRYSASGRAQGAPLLLEEAAERGDHIPFMDPAPIRLAGGGWMVFWKRFRPEDGLRIMARTFDADGTPGNERGWGSGIGQFDPLHAFPYGHDRILVVPEGNRTPPFVVGPDGIRIRDLAFNPSMQQGTNRIAVSGTAPIRFLLAANLPEAGRRELILLDSNLTRLETRNQVRSNRMISALCVTADGTVALIDRIEVGPASRHELSLFDPGWP